MKCHQRIVRERKASETSEQLFAHMPDNTDLFKTAVEPISFGTASKIILEYEWIGTMPLPKSCRYIYGIYFGDFLGGCIVYVEPSTRQFNASMPRQVVQLNRGACLPWTPKNTASYLISKTYKPLKEDGVKLIIAYCTKEAGEVGTIYQALNWWYIGETAPSKAYFLDNHWVSERTLADKHKWAKSRGVEWQNKFKNLPSWQLQGKYRYVHLLGNYRENKKIVEEHGFERKPYPKRELSEL
jgi:hypothetical protein